MRMNFKPWVWVVAVVVGIGIIGSAVRSIASPAMNESGQGQDYPKNKRCQQGRREGKDDTAHKRDHFRKRHFNRDEDNRAYPAGNQQGHVIDIHIG
jgi:hypothetical protein